MRIILFIVTCLGITYIANAQTKVTGTVINEEKKPVGSVIVKVASKGKMLGYGTTSGKGIYFITLKENLTDSALISFSHISYDPVSETIKKTKAETLVKNIMLMGRSVALREVTVKARPIFLKGDTLSYNLASFLGKGDVTLEDGLKRLPGVCVSNGGSISYMGLPIAEFQIEGLDLLGERYSLATKNMMTDQVTRVEIMRRFHKHKVDKNEQSDAVAFNVKLSPKAKLKPIGTEETGIGYMQGGNDKWLGKLGLTGMLFTKNFQTISSVKTGNYFDYGRGDWGMDVSTTATKLLPGWGSGASAPADYIFQHNGMASLNAIQRLDSIHTLRVNADYSYHRQTSEVLTQNTYLSNDGNYITVGEQTTPYQYEHQAKFSATYNEDAKNHYLYEEFALKANFETNEGNLLYQTDGVEESVIQHRKQYSLEASNNISYAVKRGKHRTDLYSVLNFRRTPTVRLNFENEGRVSTQTAKSTQLSMNNSMDYSLNLGKGHYIHMPISLGGSLEFVETDRMQEGLLSGHNRLHGGQISPGTSPYYNWTSPNKRLFIEGRLPLTWNFFWVYYFSDRSLQFTPNATIKCTFNANNKLTFNSGYSQWTGDLAQMLGMMLTDTIQTSYRSYTATTTGIIGHYKNWNTSLDWNYQQPLNFFTFHANLSHNRSWQNVLYSQSVNGIDLTNTSLAQNSQVQSTNISLSASKNIPSLFAKFNISSNYGFGSSQTAVNGQMIEPHTRKASCDADITFSSLSWLELKYDCHFGWNRTTYADVRNEQTSFGHNVELHIFPVDVLDFSLRYNYTRLEVSDNHFKQLSMLGASTQWKLKKEFVLRLELNNLLNQRHYAYTVFDGINTFSYDTYLCGRNVMLSVIVRI